MLTQSLLAAGFPVTSTAVHLGVAQLQTTPFPKPLSSCVYVHTGVHVHVGM